MWVFEGQYQHFLVGTDIQFCYIMFPIFRQFHENRIQEVSISLCFYSQDGKAIKTAFRQIIETYIKGAAYSNEQKQLKSLFSVISIGI